MPFVEFDVDKQIEKLREEDSEFKKDWDESRDEYRLIGEMISLRKKENITQKQLANITGNKQQAISRIEKREVRPSLRMFCNLIKAMGYELQIVRKS